MSTLSRQSRQNGNRQGEWVDRSAAAEILSISQRTLDRYVKSKRLTSRKSKGRVWLNKDDLLAFKAARDEMEVDRTSQVSRQHRDVKSDTNYGVISSRHQSRQVDTGVDKAVYFVDSVDREIGVLSQELQQVLHNDKILNHGLGESFAHTTGPQYQSTGNIYQQASNTFHNGQMMNRVIYTIPQGTQLVSSFEQPLTFNYSDGVYQKLYEELKKEHRTQQSRLEAANYKVGQLEMQVQAMVPLLEYRKQKESFKKLEAGLRTELKKREMQLHKAKSIVMSERLNKWIFAAIVFGLLILQPVMWLIQK